MNMPGRTFSNGSKHRYGFNGQENSDEIAAGLTTAMYWEYDSRIGRRWNTDPVVKVWESPYASFSNNPVWFSDYNGADTTLPGGDSRNIKLPNGASGITTANGSAYELKNSTASVTPAAGTLLSFTINGKNFNAAYGDQTGEFKGYFSGDLSYTDYASQQAAMGNSTLQSAMYGSLVISRGSAALGSLGTATGTVSGAAFLPAIPLAGGIYGWNYGKNNADKVTDWVEAIFTATSGWLVKKAVPDSRTFIIAAAATMTLADPPPGTPTKVYEIGGWSTIGMKWQTLKYGVASTVSDTYGGAGNRRPDGQLGGVQGEALRSKYPHLIIGQITITVVNSKTLAHIWENNLVFLHTLRNGSPPPEQGLPFGLGSK